MYQLCKEFGYTPEQVRCMSQDDVFNLVALIAPGRQVLKWNEGGGDAIKAWARQLKKQRANGR